MKPPFQPSRNAQAVVTGAAADVTITGAPATGEWQVRLENLSSTAGEIVYWRPGGIGAGLTASNGTSLSPGAREVFTINGTAVIGFLAGSGTPTVNVTVGAGY